MGVLKYRDPKTGEFRTVGIPQLDAYSKEETLSDTTKSLYGLDADAVPNDAFAFLGKYNQHWWKRRINTTGTHYELALGENTLVSFGGYTTNSQTATVTYYDDAVVDAETGEITLIGEQTVEASYKTYTNLNVLSGKYFKDTSGSTLYYADDPNPTQYGNNGYHYVRAYGQPVSSVLVETGTIGGWVYIRSSERNTYPDSGIENAMEYCYLGVPFENAKEVPKIETGSYVGTGTYGISDKNSLTFGFEPKLVFVMATNSSLIGAVFEPKSNYGMGLGKGYAYEHRCTWSGSTVSWYVASGNAASQLNTSNVTYDYIVIG